MVQELIVMSAQPPLIVMLCGLTVVCYRFIRIIRVVLFMWDYCLFIEWRNNTTISWYLFNMFWMGANQAYPWLYLERWSPHWPQICQQCRAQWCAVPGGGSSVLWAQDCVGDIFPKVPWHAQLQVVWRQSSYRSDQRYPLPYIPGTVCFCSSRYLQRVSLQLKPDRIYCRSFHHHLA